VTKTLCVKFSVFGLKNSSKKEKKKTLRFRQE